MYTALLDLFPSTSSVNGRLGAYTEYSGTVQCVLAGQIQNADATEAWLLSDEVGRNVQWTPIRRKQIQTHVVKCHTAFTLQEPRRRNNIYNAACSVSFDKQRHGKIARMHTIQQHYKMHTAWGRPNANAAGASLFPDEVNTGYQRL